MNNGCAPENTLRGFKLAKIMRIDKIKTVGQLRKVIENLSDDYEIEMRIRRKLTDEDIIKLHKSTVRYILIHTKQVIQNLNLMM